MEIGKKICLLTSNQLCTINKNCHVSCLTKYYTFKI